MFIPGTQYSITRSVNGQIFHNFSDPNVFTVIDSNDTVAINEATRLLAALKTPVKQMSATQLDTIFNEARNVILHNASGNNQSTSKNTTAKSSNNNQGYNASDSSNQNVNSDKQQEGKVQSAPTVDLTLLCEKIIKFFSEFQFTPNYRFVNTICHQARKGEMREYIEGYFKMIDSQYTNSIIEKMKSPEFRSIESTLSSIPAPNTVINKRLKLYYGPQGTGKTTIANNEADECMVCHSAILPQDLMEDFKFVDGKPEFEPSALQRAMVEGKPIVLDEINLLPFESLRFLQSVLDGKEEFEYKGKTIKIADGFKVIGTMNLVVNGSVYALPEPLVDRAEDLIELKLSAVELQKALV